MVWFISEVPSGAGAAKTYGVLERMENVLGTLGKLVDVLSTEKAIATETVSTIIKLSHPLCRRVKCNLGLTFTVYFTTVDELDGLLLQLGYKQLSPDVPPYGSAKGRENGRPQRDRLVWVNDEGDKLTLDAKLFNSDGVLHDMTERDWQEDYLEYAVAERFIPADDEDSQGDIPF